MQIAQNPKLLLWLNTLTFILVIITNWAGGTGAIGGQTVGKVSDEYSTLLTPAGYAFGIWGLIYLMLAGFLIFQWRSHRQGDDSQSLLPGGWWFTASNIFNALWIIVWLQGYLWLSLLLIAGLYFCLVQLVFKLRMELWDAPVRVIFWVWYPICIYIGWITLALPVNLAVALKSIFPEPVLFSATVWAIIAIAAITVVYWLWIKYRNMREAALVGAWGFTAIAVKQWSMNTSVSVFALIASAILLALTIQHLLRNKATMPVVKLKRGEY